jgi:hypothetical protein
LEVSTFKPVAQTNLAHDVTIKIRNRNDMSFQFLGQDLDQVKQLWVSREVLLVQGEGPSPTYFF